MVGSVICRVLKGPICMSELQPKVVCLLPMASTSTGVGVLNDNLEAAKVHL